LWNFPDFDSQGFSGGLRSPDQEECRQAFPRL